MALNHLFLPFFKIHLEAKQVEIGELKKMKTCSICLVYKKGLLIIKRKGLLNCLENHVTQNNSWCSVDGVVFNGVMKVALLKTVLWWLVYALGKIRYGGE